MIRNLRSSIPDDHPVRAVFHQLTERGMGELRLRDKDTIDYVSNLLIDFIHPENLYRIQNDCGQNLKYVGEILAQADRETSVDLRRECYRHLGDLTLFQLGLFPESLNYGHHSVSLSFYAAQGRRSYSAVSEMEHDAVDVFRKLSDQFPQCVMGL